MIQRYKVTEYGYDGDDNGYFVTFHDYESEIAILQRQLENTKTELRTLEKTFDILVHELDIVKNQGVILAESVIKYRQQLKEVQGG